ncbi:hypothetical protein F5Y05DRAFT_237705 [Hypoxylon sp. FL0543]|nr:hypothetical protein F5Y05DRAFT_237705 [Hypoxylon sp. FL0543]
MCDYTQVRSSHGIYVPYPFSQVDLWQVEYCCQHFRFVVQKWCSVYERTNKVCAPNVTHLEIRHDELCSDCRPRSPPPWEHMIRRSKRHTPYI